LCTHLAVAAEDFPKQSTPILKQFCFDCHGQQQSEAKINFEQAVSENAFATDFRVWRKAVEMLEQGKMPPQDAAQPTSAQRQHLTSLIRGELQRTAKQHADDPGPVTLRRLTSAEYAYTIQDLTGLDLKLERDFVSDAVGGEGFANVGDVQFVQDSTLERYLAAAKQVANHLVIGSGPLDFYEDPGKTGFELSAITRLQAIYRAHGFRSSAGEGGEAFGLDRYPRAFYVAWRFRYRNELGLANATLVDLAAEEGIDRRFAEYIWSVLAQKDVSFPTSIIVKRWQTLAPPSGPIEDSTTAARQQCQELHQLVYDWQTRFGQNPDAKEESPVLNEAAFEVTPTKQLVMLIHWPEGAKTSHLRINVESATRMGQPNAVVIWNQPKIEFLIPNQRDEDPRPLHEFLSPEDSQQFRFGKHPAGTDVGPTDFVTSGLGVTKFTLPIREEASVARLTVEAKLDIEHGDDCIVRCTISQEEKSDRGTQISALLANPQGNAFEQWKAGVLEFARNLPQVSHREPAPSDRDPIPPPFDNSYNNPERNLYHYQIKYHRDDRFFVDNIADAATRKQLDQAWMDLLGSFEYHDAYLRSVARKYKLDLGGRGVAELESSWIAGLPEEPRKFVVELRHSYDSVQAAFASAQPSHVDDVLEFAARAWRRPLDDDERNRLRSFYSTLRNDAELDHRKAIRTLLTRVLMAPEFLYRAERPHVASAARLSSPSVPLSDWELASRLSYFLWSSVPDKELRRAAASGELTNPEHLVQQTRRMLRDPRARRLATEFFGQWFGFYQFDRYRGIDPKRFPEFTDSLKLAMHHEAVSFFEHILRQDRPVEEILFADYAFLNSELAAHYGIEREADLTDHALIDNLGRHHRGGLFGLGAVLTVTSAPMRTSPVKRGDWILRRVLGTPVPPPPADAGSIPADDVLDDGLTVRTRLEAHRRDVSCQNCHSRIDPLGFALEQYDAVGRWREQYRDGQMIKSSSKLRDGSEITGPTGLRDYLRDHEQLFHRTLCTKLVGYALGRRESISDVLLIDQMMANIEEDGRFSRLVENVVTSRQFRYRRKSNATKKDVE
jgi:hypothetical protein